MLVLLVQANGLGALFRARLDLQRVRETDPLAMFRGLARKDRYSQRAIFLLFGSAVCVAWD